MALFGKKTGGAGEEPPDDGQPGHSFDPEKAAKFFASARVAQDTTNYEYAMTLWLEGLRHDPSNAASLQTFFRSCASFLASKEGAKGASRETLRKFGGSKSDLDRYLASLLHTGMRPAESSPAVRSAEAAAKLGLRDSAIWLGDRAMVIGRAEKRPRQDTFVDLVELFQSLSTFDKAVQAGEIAVHLNPSDSRLAARVRNLAAESTMSRSGFDQTGQEGGFRSNIRDSEQQKRLDEGERVVKTEQVMERLIADAKGAYEANPTDKPAIKDFVKRLLERERPADIEAALAVLDRAHKQTQEVQFRIQAGDIRLRLARQRHKALEAKTKAAGDDPLAAEELDQARKNLTSAEIAEAEARVAAYPSDRVMKFELGKRLYEAGRYEDSIGLFQEAKGEPKQRVKVEQYLGHAFLKIAFHDGAIMSFRAALEGAGAADGELGMEIRYGLMAALQGKAEESGDLGAAEEADKLASGIAIQQFNYKDTRVRREQIKQMVARLKRGE